MAVKLTLMLTWKTFFSDAYSSLSSHIDTESDKNLSDSMIDSDDLPHIPVPMVTKKIGDWNYSSAVAKHPAETPSCKGRHASSLGLLQKAYSSIGEVSVIGKSGHRPISRQIDQRPFGEHYLSFPFGSVSNCFFLQKKCDRIFPLNHTRHHEFLKVRAVDVMAGARSN